MSDEAGRVIQEADAIIRKWRIELGDVEDFELGRSPEFTRDFLHALKHIRTGLGTVADHLPAFSAKRARAYSQLDGRLGRLIAYLSTLEREPPGSVDNTRNAIDQLDAILKALADLPDFEAETVNVPPPPRPAPDAPVPPEPPVPVEESAAHEAPELTSAQLLDMLRNYFDTVELHALSRSLSIPAHALTTSSVAVMALSLLEYAERHGKYQALVAEVKRLRPFLFEVDAG